MDQGTGGYSYRSFFGAVLSCQGVLHRSYTAVTLDLDLHLHSLDPARLPVVLLGGLNLIRTLGMAGIQVVVASKDRDEPAFASRYCKGCCILPPFDQGEMAVNALVRLGDRLAATFGRRVPLMYGSDEALGFIYSNRERLQRYFLFLASDPEVGEALISKDRFQALGQALGLPLPRSLEWHGRGDGSVAGTQGPVLVKPKIKIDWHHSALCRSLFGGGKARVFATGAEAASHPIVILYREQLVFQEYIPGDESSLWSYHGFADEAGEVIAAFVGRKLRTYPAHTGESSFIETARNDELMAIARDLARRCPLKGAFKMDFKRDERTGAWHLLEINARYNLWHYVGARNGMNLMSVAYDYLVHGVRPEPRGFDTKYRWLSLGLDYQAFRELSARGELSLASWLASILGSRNIHSVFAWSDLGPLRGLWSARFTRLRSRGTNRIKSAFGQWRSTAS